MFATDCRKDLIKCEKARFDKNTYHKIFTTYPCGKWNESHFYIYYLWNPSQRVHPPYLLTIDNHYHKIRTLLYIYIYISIVLYISLRHRWNKKDCPSRAFCCDPVAYHLDSWFKSTVHEFVSQRAIAAWCGGVACRNRYTFPRFRLSDFKNFSRLVLCFRVTMTSFSVTNMCC